MKNIFIVNKMAQGGHAAVLWNEIEKYLVSNSIEHVIHITTGIGDATEFTKQVTSEDEEVSLFVFGGDGTINEALNGISDFKKTTMIPLPGGSANDFVSGINLEGDSIDIIDRVFNNPCVKNIDIGRVSNGEKSRLFGVSAGIGVDAQVCLQALDSKLKNFLNKFGLGSLTYGLLTIGDIFTMPFSDGTISYKYNDNKEKKKVGRIIFCAAMNCRAEGGGIPMAPNAKADSGHLTGFYAHDISRIGCFSMLIRLIKEKLNGRKGVELVDFDKMKISLETAMCVHADGEHVGFFSEVKYECLPGKLKVNGF